jgi:hypothetical protein
VQDLLSAQPDPIQGIFLIPRRAPASRPILDKCFKLTPFNAYSTNATGRVSSPGALGVLT